MHKAGLFQHRIQAIRQQSHRTDSAGVNSCQSQFSPPQVIKYIGLKPALCSQVSFHSSRSMIEQHLHKMALGKAKFMSSEIVLIQQLLFSGSDQWLPVTKGFSSNEVYPEHHPPLITHLYGTQTCPSFHSGHHLHLPQNSPISSATSGKKKKKDPKTTTLIFSNVSIQLPLTSLKFRPQICSFLCLQMVAFSLYRWHPEVGTSGFHAELQAYYLTKSDKSWNVFFQGRTGGSSCGKNPLLN